jgi:spore coat polysaccharide biosynthesis protein SpsF
VTQYRTDQEAFWAGEFGTEYIGRNQGDKMLASNINLFTKALRVASDIQSCIEFGANIGMNLKALKILYPELDQHAVEINAEAARELATVIPAQNVIHDSILNFNPQRTWDLVFIKGVLIHINPDELDAVYDKLFAAAGKYILVTEYYNPTPVTVVYRGHGDLLFKRDFAGEFMERHPQVKLLDYGFAYRRDPHFPQDDATWFLMERRD